MYTFGLVSDRFSIGFPPWAIHCKNVSVFFKTSPFGNLMENQSKTDPNGEILQKSLVAGLMCYSVDVLMGCVVCLGCWDGALVR